MQSVPNKIIIALWQISLLNQIYTSSFPCALGLRSLFSKQHSLANFSFSVDLEVSSGAGCFTAIFEFCAPVQCSSFKLCKKNNSDKKSFKKWIKFFYRLNLLNIFSDFFLFKRYFIVFTFRSCLWLLKCCFFLLSNCFLKDFIIR